MTVLMITGRDENEREATIASSAVALPSVYLPRQSSESVGSKLSRKGQSKVLVMVGGLHSSVTAEKGDLVLGEMLGNSFQTDDIW